MRSSLLNPESLQQAPALAVMIWRITSFPWPITAVILTAGRASDGWLDRNRQTVRSSRSQKWIIELHTSLSLSCGFSWAACDGLTGDKPITSPHARPVRVSVNPSLGSFLETISSVPTGGKITTQATARVSGANQRSTASRSYYGGHYTQVLDSVKSQSRIFPGTRKILSIAGP